MTALSLFLSIFVCSWTCWWFKVWRLGPFDIAGLGREEGMVELLTQTFVSHLEARLLHFCCTFAARLLHVCCTFPAHPRLTHTLLTRHRAPLAPPSPTHKRLILVLHCLQTLAIVTIFEQKDAFSFCRP
jgi:hypothetical protein